MKKFISLFLSIVMMLFVLSGCSKDMRFTENHPYVPYITVTNTYSDEEISIRYPQIRGLGDNSKEEKINELIKNDILESQLSNCNFYRARGEILDLTVDFKVQMDTPEILSVLYTGRSTYYRNVPEQDIRKSYIHGNRVHTITIDLETVERLKLSDFTNIDAELVKRIRESEQVTNNVVESLILGYGGANDIEECRQMLSKIVRDKSDEYLLKELEDNDNSFCVTSDALIVAIGTYNAAGHFALVEIPR